MKKCLLYALFGVLAISASGQVDLPDSLRQQVAQASDTTQVDVLIEDASKLVYNDPELAQRLSLEIIRLSNSLDYIPGVAKAHDIIGVFFQNRSEFDSAYDHFHLSLKLRTQIGRSKLMAESYNNLGVINRRQGTYDSALHYYSKALELAIGAGDSLLIGNYYNNIGLVNENKADWVEAITYHTKSLQIRERLKDKKGIAGSLNNLGVVYQRMDDHEPALDYLHRSLEVKRELGNKRLLGSAYINLGVSYFGLKQYDQALSNLEKSLKVYQELNDIQNVASAYDNLSFVAKGKRDIPLAISYESKSVAIRDSIGNIHERVQSHASLSALYLKADDLQNARKQAQLSYDLAVSSKIPENLKLSAEYLSRALEASQEYREALKYHKIFSAQKDSLLDKEKLLSISAVKEKYETEKKEEQIKVQALEVARQNALIKARSQQRNILLGIAFSILLISFLLVRNYRIRLKVKEQLAAQNQDFENTRSQFFANISHEFRTPLTLILGPLKNLLSQAKLSDNHRLQLNLMDRNAKRLKRLINQLLDLSRLESGKLQVNPQEGDIFNFIRITVSSFESLAEQKSINFKQQIDQGSLMAHFDPEKLEVIIYNLLSNALKFTPAEGSVTITVELNNSPGHHTLYITVKDSGCGIDPQELSRVFDRFYQTQSSLENASEGTGIGLALTKELVELLNGNIKVKSHPGRGTIFEVRLPIVVLDPGPTGPKGTHVSLDLSRDIAAPVTPADMDAALPLLLVVEDNYDLRSYIVQCLGNDYRFIEAENGRLGLEKAREQLPDLVISDLMMREMDGLELCHLIKSTESTSHIPFIMLTAKATQKGKIEGLETGADDYIFKPFERKELYLKVRNLFEQRKKMQDKLQSELLLHPVTSQELSQDQKFLLKVRNLIADHMNDHKLNVAYLSRELGMSRTQAYRKVSALCGLSVTELIRNMRLKKAADLLEQNWGTVSDVGYEVGFNNLSYFSKCFKESYGKTPSEFLQLKK